MLLWLLSMCIKPPSCTSVCVWEINSALAIPECRLKLLMTERWHRILFCRAPRAPDPPNWCSVFKRPNHQKHDCQFDCLRFWIQLSLLFITDKQTFWNTRSNIEPRIQTCIHSHKFCRGTFGWSCIHTGTHIMQACTLWKCKCIHKVASRPAHSDTAKRIYDQRGCITVHQCEYLLMCVFVKGKGRWTECVCMCMCFTKRQADFYVVACERVCLFKAFASCLWTDSAELFWQCRSTNTETSSVGVFLLQTIQKKGSC